MRVSPSASLVDGRYQLLARLGAGSMGVVYRAEDVFLRRTVAIKVIDPSLAGDAEAIDRFKEEARALAQIRHESVVQVYAFGPHEDAYYFAMEHVEGENLDALVERAASKGALLDLDFTMNVARAIGGGLDAVHARGLVHRDVKPSNIVIEEDSGRPVLIDFGLALLHERAVPRASMVAGTPCYMSPEQARHDGAPVTARSDVYAFACTIFELLTGRPVFDADEVHAIVQAHLREAPPRIASIVPHLAPFDAPLAKALAKDPADRHASADALVIELERALLDAKRARTTIAPTTSPPEAPSARAVVLMSHAGMRRRIVGVVKKTLDGISEGCAVEGVGSIEELEAAIARGAVSIVVVDEESSSIPVPSLVERLRDAGEDAVSIVILSRSWQATRGSFTALRDVDVLPKPLSLQVLASALERIARR